MIIKVKHELPRQLAKERIEQLLETSVQKHSGLISGHEFTWNENSCVVGLSAMKMHFKGNIEILQDEVEVDVKVPLIFYGYQSKIKSVIEDELIKILK